MLGGEAEAIAERRQGRLRGGAVARRRAAQPRSPRLPVPTAARRGRARGRRARRQQRPAGLPAADRRRRGRRARRRSGRDRGHRGRADRRDHRRPRRRRGSRRREPPSPGPGPTTRARRRPAATSPEPASARPVIAWRAQCQVSISRRPSNVAATSSTAATDHPHRPVAASVAGWASPSERRRVVGLLADDLAGHRQVVLGHEHDHGTDGVGPVDAAARAPRRCPRRRGARR